MSIKAVTLLPALRESVSKLILEFDEIPDDRKKTLNELTSLIRNKISAGQKVYLNFICTHNSRRSHMAQLWAQAAAGYFGVNNIICFSGGTEATAVNPRAVKAMQDVGFNIRKTREGDNPIYETRFSNDVPSVTSFSKKYDDPFNQANDFVAVMTCSHADENCPLVLGASGRIAITYDDPKDFDNTSLEMSKYRERAHQIGREMLFAFSQVKN